MRLPAVPALLLCGLAGWLTSCERSNEASCLDKRQRARQAALADRLDEAQQLVLELKAECGPNSLSAVHHISKIVADKRQVEAERLLHSQKERADSERFPSGRFVKWATAQASRVTDEIDDLECAERGTPAFGFCEGHAPNASHMRVRYWKDQPTALRYSLETAAPISCQDLHAYRHVRDWTVAAKAYELCELTERKHRHLSALLEVSEGANRMFIFSQTYLQYDPAFEQLLRP